MQKSEIRKEIKARKALLSSEAKEAAAERVFARLAACGDFVKAQRILAYYSLPDELPTVRFLEKWENGKELFLPRVNGAELDILAFDKAVLKEGAYHIQEPSAGSLRGIEEMDLVIVPGVAFDVHGNRLGRGKGYYDRLLRNARCMKIGVCYHCQLVENIPAMAHDVPVDFVITEQGIFRNGMLQACEGLNK